jgi:hypothetical protein
MTAELILRNELITKDEFDSFSELAEKIISINLTIKDLCTKFSYRQLMYWYGSGLLISNPQKDKIKDVDFIEYCWIQMVYIMREFGMSIDAIKSIKQALLQPVNWLVLADKMGEIEKILPLIPEHERSGFLDFVTDLRANPNKVEASTTLLFIAIVDSLIKRSAISFLVNLKNEIVLLRESDLSLYNSNPIYRNFVKGSYIRVSLSEVIADFFKIDLPQIEQYQLNLLTEKEVEIVKAIRNGKAKQISIMFDQNNEPTHLEITKTEKIEQSARLIDLILRDSYQNIELKTQDGKIVYYENTLKKKLSTTPANESICLHLSSES